MRAFSQDRIAKVETPPPQMGSGGGAPGLSPQTGRDRCPKDADTLIRRSRLDLTVQFPWRGVTSDPKFLWVPSTVNQCWQGM